MRTSIAVEEARDLVLSVCRTLSEETVPLAEAAGRTAARDIEAPHDVPPFANSAMDGYAVASADRGEPPRVLRVIGEAAAGSPWAETVERGTAVRIMTGAPVPEGTGLVVPVEWTEDAGTSAVRILRFPPDGAHVRPAGQDVGRGDTVVSAGQVLGGGAVGVLAGLGLGRVPVRKRPRVALVTTGSELVEPGSRGLRPGEIYNTNAFALSVQAERAGAQLHGAYHAPDAKKDLLSVIDAARTADLVVFSGGVSMGRYDLVHEALRERGFVADFWKVMQRPGNPLLFGRLDGVPVLGLPGNPVSSSICFDQYARPAIATMLGRSTVLRPRIRAALETAFPKPPGLHVFARGVAGEDGDGRSTVRPTGEQGSNLFTSVLRADRIVHLPAAWDTAPAGAMVETEAIDW